MFKKLNVINAKIFVDTLGEPGGLPSMGSHRVRHGWSNLAAAYVDTNLFYYVLP